MASLLKPKYILMWALFCVPGLVFGVEVVSEEHSSCETLDLKQELKVYKDPTLFLHRIRQAATTVDGWNALVDESPLLTSVKGRVSMMRLGPPRTFKSFTQIARFYDSLDHQIDIRPDGNDLRSDLSAEVIPVRFCGEHEPYESTLGFVVASDLKRSQQSPEKQPGLPPSTYPNPIPHLHE